jgi:hypothetical protein
MQSEYCAELAPPGRHQEHVHGVALMVKLTGMGRDLES